MSCHCPRCGSSKCLCSAVTKPVKGGVRTTTVAAEAAYVAALEAVAEIARLLVAVGDSYGYVFTPKLRKSVARLNAAQKARKP